MKTEIVSKRVTFTDPRLAEPKSIRWLSATAAEGELLLAMRRLFAQHPELLNWVFDPEHPRLRLLPERLLQDARAFSSGEVLLVRVALSLWNGCGVVGIHELVEHLDSCNFDNVLQALRYLGPRHAVLNQAKSPSYPPGVTADPGWNHSLF
jgi:hypothetical protein